MVVIHTKNLSFSNVTKNYGEFVTFQKNNSLKNQLKEKLI